MITLTAKITLADGTIYDIDQRNILYIDMDIIDRGDISLPSPGIISNRGTLRFVDYDGRIEELAEVNNLNDTHKCSIYLKNTTTKAQKVLGEFYATEWNYDSNNREVSVVLADDLIDWQEIELEGFDLASQTTAYELYEVLVNYYVPAKWEFARLNSITQQVLSEYVIKYPFLKKGNLWHQFDKLCIACGLHIFKNYQNKVVVSYDFRS